MPWDDPEFEKRLLKIKTMVKKLNRRNFIETTASVATGITGLSILPSVGFSKNSDNTTMDKLSEIKESRPLTAFCGGQSGSWKVLSLTTFIGQPLESIDRIEIINAGHSLAATNSKWVLRGVTSNLRYTNRDEKIMLDKTPSILGKPESKYAALIPIKKSEEWWLLTQDERRKVFEDQSHHINFSSKYLSVVARKLYHSRDIGEDFDFLTWFEFAPEHSNQFDELVNYLRATEEWKYVTREIDIRLMRDNPDK
jgi:hypothetical protein